MSAEMIQSAYIGLCLRHAAGEDIRHLVSDVLCGMPLRACTVAQSEQEGEENA